MKKTVAKYLCIILSVAMLVTALPLTVYAESKVIDVYTADELTTACNEITENGGEYTINLKGNIDNGAIVIKNPGAVVTVNGNGHTITNHRYAVYVSDGATVKLGGGNSTLTLQGSNEAHETPEGNDDPGLIYVLSGSTCTMNADVTLKNHKGNNYLGGGVTVQGGTFVMNGGTIENCGIDGGSVCYGGGVAVFNSGYFEMNGGTITKCYAISDYDNESDPNHLTALGGGVFVTSGSVFTMNGGTISECTASICGGGLAAVGANNNSNYNSIVNISNGTISDNTAAGGAGVFVSRFLYAYALAIATNAELAGTTSSGNSGTTEALHGDTPSKPGLYIFKNTNSDSISITNNHAIGTYDKNATKHYANGLGGGILVANLGTNTVQIHDAEITQNNADMGSGVAVFHYKTKPEIDNCTITGNTAIRNGGGVAMIRNNDGGTVIKNTTITGNTSGDRGAGVYYDNTSSLYISGANVIQDNKYNGVLNNLNILSVAKPVYVSGALTGSQIGLSDPRLWDDNMTDIEAPDDGSAELLTSGYKANNPDVHPDQYFTSDHESWVVDRTKAEEKEVEDRTKGYRIYTVKRYPVKSSGGNPAAGYYDYVRSEAQKPGTELITTLQDIFDELVYRYNYKGYKCNTNTSTKKEYTATDGTTVTIQKYSSYVTLKFSRNNKYVTFYGRESYQSKAIDRALYLTPNSNTGDINNYTFSSTPDDEIVTINYYLSAAPFKDYIYEYDDLGKITAKLVFEGGRYSYTNVYGKKTTVIGDENEVRLVRKKPNYHINNEEIDDNYDNNDIFTSYVEAATKEIKVGDTIERFYTIPEVKATESSSCPYIFKGWYYDKDNDNDSNPVNFGTDKYSKDIYAHWIKVENVAKDADDDNELPPTYNNSYGGFDLVGVQVREGIKDTNFGYEKKPGGLRFVTSLNMDVVNQINAIKPNKDNIEYGYVAATNEGWINYHSKYTDRKLQYASTNTNGIDTSSATVADDNYFGFASNINCTSRRTNSGGIVKEDHRNFDNYLLYTLVITYENVNDDAKDKNVLARPYIKYFDANGLERVAYSEYRGNSNKLGGCYTSYNAIAGNN